MYANNTRDCDVRQLDDLEDERPFEDEARSTTDTSSRRNQNPNKKRFYSHNNCRNLINLISVKKISLF